MKTLAISRSIADGIGSSVRDHRVPHMGETAMILRGIVRTATRLPTDCGHGGGVFIPQLFDPDRVEVLKGPQGALYATAARPSG